MGAVGSQCHLGVSDVILILPFAIIISYSLFQHGTVSSSLVNVPHHVLHASVRVIIKGQILPLLHRFIDTRTRKDHRYLV